jgi:hypothetical protein
MRSRRQPLCGNGLVISVPGRAGGRNFVSAKITRARVISFHGGLQD